jgi:tight adherence protein B
MNTAIVVAGAAFVSIFGLMALITTRPSRRPEMVRRRLESHAVSVDAGESTRREKIDVLKRPEYSSLPIVNAVLDRFRFGRTAERELGRANIGISAGRYALIRLFAGALAFLVVWVAAANVLIALPAGLLGVMLPRLIVRRRGQSRVKAFEAQLAEGIDLLVGSLRAGHGFLQGLESVSEEMSDPMREELKRVLELMNVGVNPVEALQEMSDRIPSYDLSLLVAAISVQRQTGGNLAEVLENLAATVRERRRVRNEVHALTTGPRVSAYVLSAIPTALFFYFITISSDYRQVMLNTRYGHMCLLVAAVMSMLGFVFSRKVAKVEY